MRRKAGSLVPLEVEILETLILLRRRGVPEAYGYLIAAELRSSGADRRLTAYGSLYKALDRLAESGAVESRWEDPEIAALEGRPRRRYHRITAAGEAAREAAEPVAQPGLIVDRGALTS